MKSKLKSKIRMATIKGYVAGLVTVISLSTVVALAAPQTLQAIFGVRVSLNGQMVNFDADSQPFVVDGRTFLPLRAIADTLGLDVAFDSANNVAVLTGPDMASTAPSAPVAPTPDPVPAEPEPTPEPAPVATAAPLLQVLSDDRISWSGFTVGAPSLGRNGSTFSIGDRVFPNSLHNMRAPGNANTTPNFFHFELNGEFTLVTGYVGAINGEGNAAALEETQARVRFFADGQEIAQFVFFYQDPAQAVSLDVTGVTQLTVEFTNAYIGNNALRPTFGNPQIR